MIVCICVAWSIYLRGTSFRVLIAASAAVAVLITGAVAAAFMKARACDARRTDSAGSAFEFSDAVNEEHRRAREAFVAEPTSENTIRLHAAMVVADMESEKYMDAIRAASRQS
jgi:hypothetical protein